ncbi:diaminopimelate epimerase [Winogradskyella sp. A3E31]|uniref:diaminopimelate epimerase n=1 Tax=Winogradskyella sp. A3E31 TaxID=3349637 RepID=UPI00398AFD09
MKLSFYKYQGTGNDFIIIDNRQLIFDKNNAILVANLCDRRFGIGGDGLILLENHPTEDFKMVYFNSDGNESSMCGNGGRCIVAFAKDLGLITFKATFEAIDGLHKAEITNDIVELQMQNVSKIENHQSHLFLDTGSPHHVELTENIESLNIKEKGAKIRYGDTYGEKGSNVNFVKQLSKNRFAIRTYERGVEDETLSCGTGVTAVALAMHNLGKSSSHSIQLKTQGGDLTVRFKKSDQGYHDIWLIGAATFVFKGEVEC